MTTHARETHHHPHMEIVEDNWSSAGQAVATSAGAAAIIGLLLGPEGAAAGALIGGVVGLVLAFQHLRSERKLDDKR